MFSYYHNTPYSSPYLHSSYHPQQQRPIPYQARRGYPMRQDYGYRPDTYERVLAQEQARRAQYLPHEEEDEDDYEYGDMGRGYPPAYGLSPRERMYLEAKRLEALEQVRRQEEQQRAREVAEEQAREEQTRRLADRVLQQNNSRRESPARSIPISAPRRSASPGTRPTSASPLRSKRSPSLSPPPPPPPQPQYTPQHHSAASTLQSHYRTHRAHRLINTLEAQFWQLKAGFTRPTMIDFQTPDGSTVSLRVPDVADDTLVEGRTEGEPRLAYTHTNTALLAYAEELSRLLVKLDAVESWGVKAVRERRRGVVRSVEAEAEALEKLWKGIWAAGNLDVPKSVSELKGDTDAEMQTEEQDTAQTVTPPSGGDDIDMQDLLSDPVLKTDVDVAVNAESPTAALDHVLSTDVHIAAKVDSPCARTDEGEMKEVQGVPDLQVEGGNDSGLSLPGAWGESLVV